MLVRTLTAALAAAFAIATCLAAPAAYADTRTIEGSSLVLSDSMSDDMLVNVSHSLTGQVRVTMDGDLSCLSIIGKGSVVISTSGCDGHMTVDVPPGMPLTITGSGSGNIRFANDISAALVLSMSGSGDVVGHKVMGPLVLAVHGANDVSLGAIEGEATLDMAGSGDVRLSSIAGPFVLKHDGSGDLAVGHIEADSVTIDSTGSGDMLLGRGSIRNLQAHMQGSGDLGIAAEVHDGDVRAYGGGDVKLGQVTGTLTKANGDSSDIYVGGPAIVDTIVGQVAKQIANHGTSESGSGAGHSFGVHGLMILVLGIAAFIIWRIMRRPGGFTATRPSRSPTAPTNLGVLAVCEKMGRLEERLARVETYVTSREFDLHQKFRNL